MRRRGMLVAVLALISVAAHADPILINGNSELGPPLGGSMLKSLRVSVGGFTHDYPFDSTGQAEDSRLWDHVRFSVVATGATSTPNFASLSDSSSSYAALIDHARVHRTPDPGTTLLLLGIGLVGLLVGLRARWKTSKQRGPR